MLLLLLVLLLMLLLILSGQRGRESAKGARGPGPPRVMLAEALRHSLCPFRPVGGIGNGGGDGRPAARGAMQRNKLTDWIDDGNK